MQYSLVCKVRSAVGIVRQLLLLPLTAKIQKMQFNLVCKVRSVVGPVGQFLLMLLTAKIQYNLVYKARSVVGPARQLLLLLSARVRHYLDRDVVESLPRQLLLLQLAVRLVVLLQKHTKSNTETNRYPNTAYDYHIKQR